jgi:hypothetical protein
MFLTFIISLDKLNRMGEQADINLNNMYTDTTTYFTSKVIFHENDENLNLEQEIKKEEGIYISKFSIEEYNTISNTIDEHLKSDKFKQEALKQIELNWNEAILTAITNILRPIIYQAISKLNEKMGNYATAVISGGEAFNLNMPIDNRLVTSDIDTKIILCKGASNDPFKFLSFLHLFWYDYLETVLAWLHEHYEAIYNTYLSPLNTASNIEAQIIRKFGIKFYTPEDVKKGFLPFQKRLTIIPERTAKDNKPAVLFDIYLYAIDFYFKESYKIDGEVTKDSEYKYKEKIIIEQDTYAAGILDLPIMREGFLGYDIGETKQVKEIIVPELQVKPVVSNTLTLIKWNGELYKGIDGKSLDTTKTSPQWFGSRQTAILYSTPTEVGRYTNDKVGSVYKFTVNDGQHLNLLEITDPVFVKVFTEQLLYLYDITSLSKLQEIDISTSNNMYKHLLRALTTLGVINVVVQKEVYDMFVEQEIPETKKDIYESNFEDHCKPNFVIKGQRFSETQCDTELGKFIEYIFDESGEESNKVHIDGYIGRPVESCWHGGRFHAEICLFNKGLEKLKEWNNPEPKATVGLKEYNDLKRKRFEIDDDEFEVNKNFTQFKKKPEETLVPIKEHVKRKINEQMMREGVEKLPKVMKGGRDQGSSTKGMDPVEYFAKLPMSNLKIDDYTIPKHTTKAINVTEMDDNFVFIDTADTARIMRMKRHTINKTADVDAGILTNLLQLQTAQETPTTNGSNGVDVRGIKIIMPNDLSSFIKEKLKREGAPKFTFVNPT